MKRLGILIALILLAVPVFANTPTFVGTVTYNFPTVESSPWVSTSVATTAGSTFVVMGCAGVAARTLTAVSYNGQVMTNTTRILGPASANPSGNMWYLNNPSTGTVSYTFTGGTAGFNCVFQFYKNVNVTTPIAGFISSSGSATPLAVTCTGGSSTSPAIDFAFLAGNTLSAPVGTSRANNSVGSGNFAAGSSEETGAASNVFGWTSTAGNWAEACMYLQPDIQTTVAVDSTNLWKSPYFNVTTGSTSNLLTRSGTSLRLKFSGVNGVAVTVDTTQQSSCPGGVVSGPDYPGWAYKAIPNVTAASRVVGAPTARQETSSDGTVLLFTALSPAQTYNFEFMQNKMSNDSTDRWSTVCAGTRITGFVLTTPTSVTFSAPDHLSKIGLATGDSTCEGYTSTTQDFRWSWVYNVFKALGAEGGVGCIEGVGLVKTNGAGVPNWQTAWMYSMNGVSLLNGGGTFITCPDFLLNTFGIIDDTKDGNGGVPTDPTVFQTDYAAVLAAQKVATVGCNTKIIASVPIIGVYRTQVLAAAASTTGIYTIDANVDSYFGEYVLGPPVVPTEATGDGLHPEPSFQQDIAAKMMKALQVALTPAGSSGGSIIGGN